MSIEENKDEQDLPSFQKDKIEGIKREEERRKQWRQEMEENSSIQQYFEQFNPDSVKSFIDTYFVYKNIWVEHGDLYSRLMQEGEIHWASKASEYLEYILQKKLFDLQCLWRAEKIELKEVQLSIDFQLWEHNIFNCPFLEPISAEDIELMQQFLNQDNADTEMGWFDNWQDYEEIKEAYNTDNANRNFPEWYEFYNGRKGTGVYMLLPDIRGEKEEFYMDLWRESKKEEWAEQRRLHEQNSVEQKKYISYYEEGLVDWFVSTFENKEVQHFYKAYKWSNKDNNDKEMMEEDLKLLFEADEYVPIEANMDWKEAIRIAAQKYRLRKIAEALPLAYEQYLMNIQLGIGFPNENRLFESFQNIKQDRINCILIGRKLNGEPEDLNF